MTRKTMLGLLAVLAIGLLTVPVYADTLSPLKQSNMGVPINEIQCNDKILMQSPSGKPVCLTESTADKLMDRGYSLVIFMEEEFVIITKESLDDANSWISSATDLSYMDLEKIPNPEGYWVPIPEEHKENMRILFVNATGDSLTDNTSGKSEINYLTKYGHISESSTFYILYDYMTDNFDKKKFSQDFMNSMGFEYDEKDISIHSRAFQTTHYYAHEFSTIKFSFNDNLNEIKIGFSGWTNNPELVIFDLSEEEAIQKAFNFIKTTDEYYISESDDGKCDISIHKSATVLKYVEDGIPSYKIKVGHCTHSIGTIINADLGVYVKMNGINANDIHSDGGFY